MRRDSHRLRHAPNLPPHRPVERACEHVRLIIGDSLDSRHTAIVLQLRVPRRAILVGPANMAAQRTGAADFSVIEPGGEPPGSEATLHAALCSGRVRWGSICAKIEGERLRSKAGVCLVLLLMPVLQHGPGLPGDHLFGGGLSLSKRQFDPVGETLKPFATGPRRVHSREQENGMARTKKSTSIRTSKRHRESALALSPQRLRKSLRSGAGSNYDGQSCSSPDAC